MNDNNKPSKCYAHNHLTMNEYALWDVARSLSYGDGVLYFNGRNIAARFKGADKSTMYRLAKSLLDQGWFVVLKDTTRRRDGTWSPRQYRVLSHAEWAAAHPTACDGLHLSSDDEDSEPVPTQDKPVPDHVLDASQPVPIRTSPVPIRDQPVPQDRHNLMLSSTDIKTTDAYSDNLEPVALMGLDNKLNPQSDADVLINRFLKKTSDRAAIAIATQFHPAPVPITGQAALDTQAEAVRLSSAICVSLGLSMPQATAPWTSAVKAILDKGHAPETVMNGARFVLEHPNFGPSAMRKTGPEAFAQDFGEIVQGMSQQTKGATLG